MRKGLTKMLKSRMVTILAIFIFIFISQAVFGEVSFGVSFDSHRDYYIKPNERITTEKRNGYDVDDWIERGSSSVTESPKYKNGIRLSTWANRYNDDYNFGLASAVYLFRVPNKANDAKVIVRYDGSYGKYSDDDNIAGRLWIKARNNRTRYYQNEGRYENEALYGDTFILRENKRKEEITVSLRDHVINGIMEIHIIAEGGQLIDINDIKIESYTSLPEVKIISREYSISKPWYNNTYLYFYTGPVYHFGNGYYVCFDRFNERHIIEVRRQYGIYLSESHLRHPNIKIYWSGKTNSPRFNQRNTERVWLDKWTPEHETARKSYGIISQKTHKPSEVREIREQVQRVTTERRNMTRKDWAKDERKEDKENDRTWLKELKKYEDDDRKDRRDHIRNR